MPTVVGKSVPVPFSLRLRTMTPHAAPVPTASGLEYLPRGQGRRDELRLVVASLLDARSRQLGQILGLARPQCRTQSRHAYTGRGERGSDPSASRCAAPEKAGGPLHQRKADFELPKLKET